MYCSSADKILDYCGMTGSRKKGISYQPAHRKYSWPLVLLWCPEMGKDKDAMWQYFNKEESLPSCFSTLFCFVFVLANPSAFYPRICFSQFYGIKCATYEHSIGIELLLFLMCCFQQNPDLWFNEYNASKWWIKIPTYQGTLCTLLFLYFIYSSLPRNPPSLLDFDHSTTYTPAEPGLIVWQSHCEDVPSFQGDEHLPVGWYLKATI